MATSKPMNLYHEFLRLVYRLRKHQKAFFREHQDSEYKLSKQYEAEVDQWLERCGFEAQKLRQLQFNDLEALSWHATNPFKEHDVQVDGVTFMTVEETEEHLANRPPNPFDQRDAETRQKTDEESGPYETGKKEDG